MLGKFIWKFGKPFAKLLFDMPKSYQSHMMNYLENHIHICYLSCIELCQIVVTLERILFMLSWSRFTCTPYTPLLCFFEKLALYHPLIPQNKCSTICVGLSLSLQFLFKKKRGMGYWEKKIWTHEGPSIEKKIERKKCGHMKVHEKKKR